MTLHPTGSGPDFLPGVQPLPFANMRDTYPVLNGRGYPDTTLTDDVPEVEHVHQEISALLLRPDLLDPYDPPARPR